MSAQTVSACVVCGAATDRFLCGDERAVTGCLGKLLRDLGDCAALVEELDTTISRCDKLGGASVGYVSNGGDEQPLPINLAATESKLLLRDRLVSWCRDLWETNAARDADGSIPPLDLRPGVLAASRWLMRHPSWIALHPAVDDLYDEVRETIRLAWRAVDAAPSKSYIGQCSAVLDDWWEGEHEERPEGPSPMCLEDLYVDEGRDTVQCRACSTRHDVHARRSVLLDALEEQVVPAALLAGLTTRLGVKMTSSTIRSYVHRGKIVAIRRTDKGLPLYRVGDVLDAFLKRTQNAA